MSLHASPDEKSRTETAWSMLLAFLLACLVATTAIAGVVGGQLDRTATPHERGVAGAETNILVIEETSEEVHYEVTVEGSIEPAGEPYDGVERGDEVNGTSAQGVVTSDADVYRITGNVTSIALAGNATLSLNGNQVTPGGLASQWAATFSNCSSVDIDGSFADGYVFSTILFPVEGPSGDVAGFEENPINEHFDAANRTEPFRVGETLPSNVSEQAAVRVVYLYEEPTSGQIDPLLLESEVMSQIGEPTVRVENPAHESCRTRVKERLENETEGEGGTARVSPQVGA